MITPNAQLLVLFGSSLALKKEVKESELPSPYRSFCADCDEAGLDARHPCPGH